jgi:hypothetical protein
MLFIGFLSLSNKVFSRIHIYEYHTISSGYGFLGTDWLKYINVSE